MKAILLLLLATALDVPGELPSSGEYRVTVLPTRGTAGYEPEVSIR